MIPVSLLDSLARPLVAQDAGMLAFARIISDMFSPQVLATVTVFLVVVLLEHRHRDTARFIGATMVLNLALISAIKLLTQRARPQDVSWLGYSFPSGHAMTATVFFGILSYFAYAHLRRTAAHAILAASAAIIVMVGWSRIALNVHWLSDVLAGYFFGGALLAAMILLHRSMDRQAR